MRIVEVRTCVLRLSTTDVYLGPLTNGQQLRDEDGYVVRAPWRSLYSARNETVLVRLRTDDGSVGWGEALAPVGPEVVATAIDQLLAPQLLGRDPRRVRPAWSELRDLMRERGHLVGHQADALAAVDIALWDLAGKVHQAPLADLLGGAFRTAVPTYVSGLPKPTDTERAELAERWAKDGATAMKLHLGQGVEADLATFDAVAAAAPAARIAVDAHWAYSKPEALRLGQGLDARGALFLEAPVAPEDVRGHADLAARLVTPVAVGESLRNRYEFLAWMSEGALGLVQPDVARTGVTEAMVIAELAAAHHLPVAPHHSVGLGIAIAAGIHLAAAVDNLLALEYQPTPFSVAQRILRTPLRADASVLHLPNGHGLGVDVDEDFVVRNAVRQHTVKENET
ncbi:mandelate racemase/muconate lactonizing enzyme family protein [Actinopolymorpha pittospori]|uniref:Galactonate dehydratase n=1 Tax=Actinopolymorpha pittospori TaxID=648752 RepID=A0A927RFD3_9ACTN|nr:galactonate dehydratase [Actinopolymorpha pittospori]